MSLVIKEYEKILKSKEFKETNRLLLELKERYKEIKDKKDVVFKIYQELFNNILSRTKKTGVFIGDRGSIGEKEKHEFTIGKFGLGIKRSWSERSYGIGQWEFFSTVLPILDKEKIDKMSNCIRSKVKKDLFVKFLYFVVDNKKILTGEKSETKIETIKKLSKLTKMYGIEEYNDKPHKMSGRELRFVFDDSGGYEVGISLGSNHLTDLNVDNINEFTKIIIYEQVKDTINIALKELLKEIKKTKKKEIEFSEKLNTEFGKYIIANKL